MILAHSDPVLADQKIIFEDLAEPNARASMGEEWIAFCPVDNLSPSDQHRAIIVRCIGFHSILPVCLCNLHSQRSTGPRIR